MGCNNSKSDDTTAGLSPKGIAMSSGTMKPTGPSESEKHIELHIASRNKRNNVIAQAQLDGDIETPSFDKTPEQGVLIDNVIKSPDAFFFTGVHQDDLAVIKQAMEVCKVRDPMPSFFLYYSLITILVIMINVLTEPPLFYRFYPSTHISIPLFNPHPQIGKCW